MPVKLTAIEMVSPDVLVDGFVADGEHTLECQMAADLLGTEVGADQVFHEQPIFGGKGTLAPGPRSAAI